MTWRDKLNPKERAELERSERNRNVARAEHNAIRDRLKSRAEARIRKEKRREYDKQDG